MTEKIDGTTTDVDIAKANSDIAFQFDGVSTSNIVDKRTKSVSLNGEALNKIEEDKEKNENLGWFDRLLNWLFPTDEELKTKKINKHTDKITKELAEMGLLSTIDPDGEVKINKDSKVQIISILEDHHFTTAILDNENKSLVLIDPNGHILNTAKFKDCKSQRDIFEKLFGAEEARRLVKEGYTICDGNHNKGEIISPRDRAIFGDNIAINDGQKNGNQTENGACGPVCHMMVRNYMEQRFNPQHQSIKDIIQEANKQSVSTTATIKTELNAIKKGNHIKPNFEKIRNYKNQAMNKQINNSAKNNTLNLNMDNRQRYAPTRNNMATQQQGNSFARY